MNRARAAFVGSALLAGVTGCEPAATAASPPIDAGSSDAGSIQPSTDAACDPTGAHDAATFAFTATCAGLGGDAGGAGTCAEWSEGPEGDWTPFAESCLSEGGTLETTPCPEAGLGAACTLPATCTTQTTLFYYGSASGDAAQAACAASGGSFAP